MIRRQPPSAVEHALAGALAEKLAGLIRMRGGSGGAGQ
jgi:hypothetical protein